MTIIHTMRENSLRDCARFRLASQGNLPCDPSSISTTGTHVRAEATLHIRLRSDRLHRKTHPIQSTRTRLFFRRPRTGRSMRGPRKMPGSSGGMWTYLPPFTPLEYLTTVPSSIACHRSLRVCTTQVPRGNILVTPRTPLPQAGSTRGRTQRGGTCPGSHGTGRSRARPSHRGASQRDPPR